MGRELQKKKNKSSIARVRQKPKSKKLNIKGPAIVAANWDQSLTLSQNYRRLGLASKLNSRTGGTEKSVSKLGELKKGQRSQDPLAVASKLPTKLAPQEVQIERDPKSGRIVRIIRPKSTRTNPLNDPFDALSDQAENEGTSSPTAGGIVRQLEEQAALEIKPRPRQQSRGEEHWIEALVARHGDNYYGMLRDRKLNPLQQTEGDLRRRIRKWRDRAGATSSGEV